jgi:hypothetical protein
MLSLYLECRTKSVVQKPLHTLCEAPQPHHHSIWIYIDNDREISTLNAVNFYAYRVDNVYATKFEGLGYVISHMNFESPRQCSGGEA